MIIAILMAGFLVALCFYLHLAVMRRLARYVLGGKRKFRRPLLLVLFTLFAAHVFEVMLYALGHSILDLAGLGSLSGEVGTGFGNWMFDHFYFSIASYTTLGIGDIVPHGPIRLISGVEALNGLVMIAWSASFTYLMMERLWGVTGPPDDEVD